MRILITGSGGVVGGYLAQACLSEGHTVLATYRTTPPRIAGAPERLRLFRVDYAQGIGELGSAGRLEPADVIVHAAAQTPRLPGSTASDYIHANLIGTLRLMEYATTITPRLFVYLSAMSVYGEVAVDEVDEDTPLARPGLYGASKYLAELIVREAGGAFPVLCVRLPGVAGRGDFTSWVGRMLRSAMRHEPMRIYNPDALFNNLVDLQELARFIHHLIERGGGGCDLVNLAASEPMRIREVVALLRSLTGSRSEVLVMAGAGKRSFAISTARLRDRLGFHPATTRAIICRYVTPHVASDVSPSRQAAAVAMPGAGR